MAKATKATAETKKKNAATTTKAAAARKPAAAKKPAPKKPVAKKVAAKKAPAKKTLVKKVAAKKPAAAKTKVKVAAKAKKPATTVAARAGKPARPAVRGAKKPAPTARRLKSAVLEVSPAVIDTTSAAEVAARLVVGHTTPQPFHPLSHLFEQPPMPAVKRGSSALRHVKEMLNKPVARQLEGVFGPAPVSDRTMRRFLRNQKKSNFPAPHGGTHVHVGPPTVPHRSVGNGGSRAGAPRGNGGGE